MVYLKKKTETALNESLAIAHSAKLGGWRIKGDQFKTKMRWSIECRNEMQKLSAGPSLGIKCSWQNHIKLTDLNL